MTTEETGVKAVVKDYLKVMNIFNYPMLQGIASFKGLPDRVMHYKGRVHYLEIKKPKGSLSPSQLNFKLQCDADGIDYHIIKSLEDLQEIIE